jgi:hypothetical protein
VDDGMITFLTAAVAQAVRYSLFWRAASMM